MTLHGRDRELTQVDDVLERARAGSSAVLVVTGEVGIGKSALARAAAQRAQRAGMRVAWGRCWETGGAWWPWIQVFRGLGVDPFGDEIPTFQVFDAATRALEAVAAATPLVVIVEDVDVADRSSVELLRFLAHHFVTTPIALIATARDPDVRATPGLHELLLQTARAGEHVSLARLMREHVAAWVGDEDRAAHVYEISEGVPLFVKEMLRLGGRAATDGIVFVIDRHLKRLPDDVRDLLRHGAVHGRRFDVDQLRALTGLPRETVRDRLRVACTLGVVELVDASTYELTHVLLRERLAAAAPAPPAPSHITLQRDGDTWAIEGGTRRPFRLKHGKGLAYLSTLLEHPDEELHVLALIGADHHGDAGPVLDAQARAEYRARLASLEHELSEAEAHGDLERARIKRAAIEALADHLARALGLGGRDRRAASDVERARINVRRRIKDALDAIASHDPQLARYLRATVATGTSCRFSPVSCFGPR